ncbi:MULTISPECIES: hypothetical protein [unclassified Variovorax]|uniref:hypothetical protein n=1 Tax=unclassified Variovorax TaxID=663243 RepID=UPI0013E06C08|nr:MULTISPECIES: hypothetical protein [unclassified Variovorax]
MGPGFTFPKPLEPIDSKIKVSAFPEGPQLWRIDWFGPIAYPDRYGRNRQPSVLVFLSRVDPQSCTYEGQEHHSQQKKVWVSVGTTMMLRIGDVWKDQRPHFEPAHTSVTFRELAINSSTLSLVKAGSGRADGSFLLPMDEHPWHMNNTHSYCAQVEMPSGKSLLIPCMELVRFYFGSSSALLSRLFTPPLSTEMLYSAYGYDEYGKLVITLADFLPAASAEDVARIATSKIALHAAQLIGSSCQQASAIGQDIYPMARFPFEGKTDLKVAGRWLDPQGAGTFLVYRIESCSHPFPFKALKYQLSTLQKPRYKPGPEHRAAQAAADSGSAGTRPAKDPGLVETDASKSLAPQTFRRPATRKFTDLENKRVWGTSIAKELPLEQAVGQFHPSVEAHALGGPGSDERVRPAELIEASESRVLQIPPPPFAKVLLQAMELQQAVNVELLTTTRDGSNVVPLELLSDEDGVIADELIVRDGFRHRPRRAIAFALRAPGGDRTLMCIVVEAETIFPLMYPIQSTEEAGIDMHAEFETAFRHCAADFMHAQASATTDLPESGFKVAVTATEAAQSLASWITSLFKRPD